MSTPAHHAAEANRQAYDDYYHKPDWWFRWRYDTQVKRKVCLALARRLRRRWDGASIFELGFGSLHFKRHESWRLRRKRSGRHQHATFVEYQKYRNGWWNTVCMD